MRRKDREITDIAKLNEILDACQVFRVGMAADQMPYVVPLNYGYRRDADGWTFYFHCVAEGKKLDIMRQNSRVCIELDTDHALIEGNVPCQCSFNFSSIIGFGEVAFAETAEEKIEGLKQIMKHLTGKDVSFEEKQVQGIAVGRISVKELTGKQKQ